MQLSIIIVNYNVRYFLEQCLYSAQKAMTGIEAELIVVDNNSADGSLAYLQPRFPGVRFIASSENLGFAKACNMGMRQAGGEYILFLNPDTIVPEDCFSSCLRFFATHPRAGALGIKMLDGKGQFLRESKRAFPSPMTSLFKLFGLANLFPASKTFSKYHLGYLDENQDHEVDVLAGAFMMIPKEVLEKVGGFDETFFMYGEDVDLSYRIQKAGYSNYYFAGSYIIHFKGESTRKGSMNYVRMFYNAMSIFVRKHYGGSRAGIFHFLIHLAIWVRAALSALGRFVRRIGLPLIDAGLILLSFWIMKNIWNQYVRTDIEYENRLLWIAFPAYTVFYLITAYFAGLYDRWYKWTGLVRSTIIATIVLLAAYALLPEQYRFSRGIILFGAILAFLLISILRWVLIQTKVLTSNKEKEEHASTLIAGSPEEYLQVVQLMKEAGLQERILGRVAVDDNKEGAIGQVSELNKLLSVIPFREIIFCQGQLSYAGSISVLRTLPGFLKIKFHAAGSGSIVGSESKDTSGEALSTENGFKLGEPGNRRIKRQVDIIISFLALASFPLHFLLLKKPFSFFANCFAVLTARKTWVGYIKGGKQLPPLRKAVMTCNGFPAAQIQQLPGESLHKLDYWYARDYEPVYDLKLLWRRYRHLGG